MWDAVTLQCQFSMSSHSLAVSCVRWGGDGLLYSASKDATINVWDSKVWGAPPPHCPYVRGTSALPGAARAPGWQGTSGG